MEYSPDLKLLFVFRLVFNVTSSVTTLIFFGSCNVLLILFISYTPDGESTLTKRQLQNFKLSSLLFSAPFCLKMIFDTLKNRCKTIIREIFMNCILFKVTLISSLVTSVVFLKKFSVLKIFNFNLLKRTGPNASSSIVSYRQNKYFLRLHQKNLFSPNVKFFFFSKI